ncbi:methyltransferase [Aegicerativicinus sediminis]
MPAAQHKAIDAIQRAHQIAFAPFIFQTVISLRKLEILDLIFEHESEGGITLKSLSEKSEVDLYGLGVLLELAETMEIVLKNEEGKFQLSKIGYFLNFNESIIANLNFANDVCYKGLYHLPESVSKGTPEGLKELGNYQSIYQGLSTLPHNARNSWFRFDHFYSDEIFDEALEKVYRNCPKDLFDVGANTGRFALKVLQKYPETNLSLIDLPGQLDAAKKNLEQHGLFDKVNFIEIDWLGENPKLTKNADAIWMSQFLDCFSETEIISILKVCSNHLNSEGQLFIVETLTDRQRFPSAKMALEATSLYFTALANGNSKMYSSEVLKNLVEKSGLEVVEDLSLGDFHTMFVCQLKK